MIKSNNNINKIIQYQIFKLKILLINYYQNEKIYKNNNLNNFDINIINEVI